MFNQAVHDHLVAMGYVYTHHAEVDVSTPESGPNIFQSWDEYVFDDHRVIVSHLGRVELSEDRDLEFEAWCDERVAESEADVLALGYTW